MLDKKSVLVVSPHPDDAEVGAGGTIAHWAAEGRRLVLVVCTNGDKGTSDRAILPEELAETRRREQLAAGDAMGVDEVVLLGYADQTLEDTYEFRGRIVREIRKHRPEVVITCDPNRKYINHRDHRNTGRVTLDAVYPYARDHLAYPEHLEDGLEPHKVREVYLWGSDEPDCFLEISEKAFEAKRDALSCHVSQFGERGERDEERETRARAGPERIGKKIGVPLAEQFKLVSLGR